MPFIVLEPRTSPTIEDGLGSTEDWDRALEKSSTYVLPLASVLVSASMGLFTFLSSASGSANTVSPVSLWSSRGVCADHQACRRSNGSSLSLAWRLYIRGLGCCTRISGMPCACVCRWSER